MQTKEVTTVEIKSTLDEVNNILIAHIQKQFGVKIENVAVDREGVITFSGKKSKDFTAPELMYNAAEGDNLASTILGGGKKEKRVYVKKNVGLTDWLRGQLAGGEKIHIDYFVENSDGHGFEKPSKSTVLKHLKQGKLKKEMIEVDKNVFQLRSAFDKTHNREVRQSVAA